MEWWPILFAADWFIREKDAVLDIIIIIATNPFPLGVLGVPLLHVTGNHQTGVPADKLDLFSAVDNHQVAVNDVVAPSVRGQTAGAIRLDRIGSGPIWGLSYFDHQRWLKTTTLVESGHRSPVNRSLYPLPRPHLLD
jgi:hypothetical protein